MFICWLSPNKKKKKKNLHNTQVYQTRVLCKFFFFFKRYLSLAYSSTVLHGTRVYQTWVPHNFFLIAQIQLSSAMVAELMKNSSFWNSNSRKKWYFAIYFQNSIFLLKISKNYDIWPFWPKNATIISSFPTQNKMTSGPYIFFFFSFFITHSVSSWRRCLSQEKKSYLPSRFFWLYFFDD